MIESEFAAEVKATNSAIAKYIAKLIAAEREACAKEAEQGRPHYPKPCGCFECVGHEMAAEAIRKRGAAHEQRV